MAKIVIWIVVLAVVVIGGLAIFSGPSGEAATIKIGAVLPLTGDAASYGESENRAIQVAVEQVNNAGGVKGRQLEIVNEDGKCDPQIAGTAAQKLVNIDKVKIIIGGACSGETLAAAEVTDPAQVILISPSATSPAITTAGDFVFRTAPSDALAGRVAARYSYRELNTRKAALITELTDYAQGLRSVFKDAFKALGGQVVADETYNTGDTDFRTQILKIKNLRPDVVYLVPQSPTPAIAIIRQLRENRVTASYVGGEAFLDPDTISNNATLMEGVFGVLPVVDWENNPKAKALFEAHRAKFNSDPGIYAANAYDAFHLIREALDATLTEAGENAGEIDTAAVRDWLYGVSNWPGAVGPLTIDENGDPVMGQNVRKVVNGELTDLGPYTP